MRVTVKLEPNQDLRSKKIRGKIVSPLLPRLETGIYWGYTVRIAKSLSDIFTKSAYEDGYDMTIGTSDKGENLQNIENKSIKFNHGLIVYGGVQGLEAALENDDNLDADDPSLLFDQYLNVVPGQGRSTNNIISSHPTSINSLLFISRFAYNSDRRSNIDIISSARC